MLGRSAKMNHVKISEDLILKAQHLSTELIIPEFRVKVVIDGDEESHPPINKEELKSRIRRYFYEGFTVSVSVQDHKVTIQAEDVG